MRSTSGNSTGHIVRRNIIANAGATGILTDNNIVGVNINNNYILFAGTGIQTQDNASGVIVANNTIVTCNVGIDSTVGNIVKNNTIMMALSVAYAHNSASSTAQRDFNNYFFAPEPYGDGGTGSNDINVDPYNVEAGHALPRVRFWMDTMGVTETDSGVIDAGTDSASPSVDLYGVSRSQGIGIDIGAYERVPEPVKEETVFNNC